MNRKKSNKQITSKDIAEACGVSRGTVDRALNGRKGISEKTRAKILETAERMGYRPNFIAQSLVKGRTMTLGVILFDSSNPIFAQIIRSIQTRARELGYLVYLTLTGKDPELEKQYIEYLVDRKVDGIALLPINFGESFEQYLRSLEIPIVTFGNRISEHFSHVWIDDYAAVQDAVHHIVARGYNEIIYVSPPLCRMGEENLYGPEKRYLGFIETCRTYNDVHFSVINHKKYLYELELLLKNNSKRTAIFCSSDVYALDIMKNLRNKGYRFPEDVGIMGFDNIDMLQYVTPAITTVDYNADLIGKTIIDSLVKKMEGQEVETFNCLEHEIIPGDSL